jgi:hypothetical protein
MKRILSGIIALTLFAACSGNSNNTTASATGTAAGNAAIKFENDAFDFGKINQGDKVTHEYKFKNESKSPLIITDSYATCGCTKPEWPHNPVKPGESGVIKVTFSSEGKVGLQDKQITIVANTKPVNTVVHLVGEVIEKKK